MAGGHEVGRPEQRIHLGDGPRVRGPAAKEQVGDFLARGEGPPPGGPGQDIINEAFEVLVVPLGRVRPVDVGPGVEIEQALGIEAEGLDGEAPGDFGQDRVHIVLVGFDPPELRVACLMHVPAGRETGLLDGLVILDPEILAALRTDEPLKRHGDPPSPRTIAGRGTNIVMIGLSIENNRYQVFGRGKRVKTKSAGAVLGSGGEANGRGSDHGASRENRASARRIRGPGHHGTGEHAGSG